MFGRRRRLPRHWRAVAAAATRAMFNDVATEARFSEQARPRLCAC